MCIRDRRYGDILDGKRTWPKELSQSNVKPTIPDAVAGDITAAMPYRAMMNIIHFIQAMDQVVPGFASYETLLYSPELKFYSNRVKMDTHFATNIKGSVSYTHLYIDCMMWMEIAENLVGNACTYASTRVDVSVVLQPPWATLTVQDDGKGFSPEALSRGKQAY